MSVPGDERDDSAGEDDGGGDDPAGEFDPSTDDSTGGGDTERDDAASDDEAGPPGSAGEKRAEREDPATPAGAAQARTPEGTDRAAPGPPTRDEWAQTAERREPPPPGGTSKERPGWQIFVYDAASSVLAVLVVGAYLYAVSGVWPPLVAVESRSMTPNMQVNDLVFVMETGRFPGPNAHGDTGVVTARAGAKVDYRTFGRPGDVVIYQRDGDPRRVPIIHRAMFWVEEGENWYAKADPEYVTASECGDTPNEGLRNCPAPHAGFITKGDSNGRYDQVTSLSGPVKPEWVIGTAEVRIPGLGWIRLQSAATPLAEAQPGNESSRPAVTAGTTSPPVAP
ncbi:MAG: S26 family signal peptidase [Haloarculaceae archaeon]